MLPFPHRDIKCRPSTSRGGTPKIEVSGSSTVPLLVLNNRTPGGSRNVSPIIVGGPSNFDGTSMATSTEQEAVLNANFADMTGTARGGVCKGVVVGSVGTLESESSGYSMRGTPPALEKVDAREPYNPSMATSLTRRLLKVRDGVITPERKREAGDEEDEDDEK